MEYEESFATLPEGDIVTQLLKKSFAARNASEQKVIKANSEALAEDEGQINPGSLVHEERLAVWEPRNETPLLLAMPAIPTPSSFPNSS